ncbi:MAG: thiamine pyrophosphate-binding protein [Gammaproteobacteria bacterium]|nr:thiamine pyrophosphate-binding protein [Gammaproteobacteria bacterium]
MAPPQVSELIVRYLERLGIDTIFGMPGAHILPVYDSLYDSKIQSVLAKHEQGAAFMAGGYARASGKIGACITTAGPGATNLVTGIANAYADKLPVLVITGEAPTYIFGKGGLQESSGEGGSIDQNELFKGITKYHKIVERTDYLANVLNRVTQILLSPNSGPVLLSFPFNVQKEMVDDAILDTIKTAPASCSPRDHSKPIAQLTKLLLEAKSPVLVAGYGCIRSGGQALVSELSESLNVPVITSLKGKGVISEQSGLSLGSLGVTSYSPAYRYIAEESDLVVFLGAGFNERTSYLWDKKLLTNKKIAQVDINEDQLEKVFKADIAINGDIKDVLSGVLKNLKTCRPLRKNHEKVRRYLQDVEKQPADNDYAVFKSRFPLVERFFAKLEACLPEGTWVFDDNIIFAQNFYNVSTGNRYFPNTGVSSLGHAIPAAIGARFAEEKSTWAILGDGGFQMCCMEIMTAVNYGIPLNIVLFNNSTMGLIRKNQTQQYNKRFINCDFINPDYAYLAKSFGMQYRHVASEFDLEALFTNDDLHKAINLIEIPLDKDAFPNYISKR